MRNSVRCLISGLLLFAIIVWHPQAQAQVPANDNYANASVISSLPFSTSEPNMGNATLEAADLDPPCRQSIDNTMDHTVWYKYTTGATTEFVTLQTLLNSQPVWISVYTGVPGTFSVVSGGCTSYSSPAGVSRIAGLRLAPNTTYSIQVGSHFTDKPLNFGVTSAVQYHVTKTTDTNDGTCDVDCSLREAISASNASPGAVIIPAGTYTLTIAGAAEYTNQTGDLDTTAGMGIYGAGMAQTVIDANHLDRAISLDAGGYGVMAFALGDLTIENGNATSSGIHYDNWGGGLAAFGGTYGGDFIGLERVAVRSSVAGQSGGGIALFSPGTIRDCWISNNATNTDRGGGLYYGYDFNRKLSISGSTFSGNSANGTGAGGGIFAQGTLFLVNSTVSGNRAAGYGGGIDLESNGSLSMANSSVVFNAGYTRNAFATQTGGGVYLDGNFPSTIVNSIIAYNTDANFTDQNDCAMGSDSGNALISSYNLVQYPNNCGFTGSGDVTGVDPGVSTSLANNGGATLTHALNTGSPALDSGDPAGCKDTNGLALTFDQRGAGFPRIVGAACDKGALESPAVTPPGAPDLASASDSGSSSSDNITQVQTPAFTGTCVDGNQIQLQVDAIDVAPVVTCASGSYAITVSAIIADGTHAITATATSASVTSLRSAPLAVTIATAPPVVTIGTHPPNPDTNPNPTFGFSSNEAGSVFQCHLDGGVFSACTSPDSISVGLGTHTFYVNATDLAGNTTATPTAFSWNVLQTQSITFDPLADVTLAQSPLTLSASASSSLGVTFSSLTGSTCSVAAATVTLLDLGTCTIRASQAGDGTTYGAAPDVDRSFAVRPPALAAPTLDAASDSGISNSDSITNATNPVFTGACTDGDSIQLNTDLAAIGSPVICSSSAYAIAAALAEGAQSISVTTTRSGVDSAASNGLNIIVDRTAPAAPSITAPSSLVAPAFTVSGSATETDGRIVVVEASTTLCTVDGPFAAGNWSCQATLGSGGTHSLSATQIDLAGNVSAASAAFDVVIDLVFRNGFE